MEERATGQLPGMAQPLQNVLLDDSALRRAAARVGTVAVASRVHRYPSRLEDDFEVHFDEVLGSGCGGDVFAATRRETHISPHMHSLGPSPAATDASRTAERFAVKILHATGDAGGDLRRRETEALLSFDHPNVVELVGVYEGGNGDLALVMESLQGGELFDRVVQAGHYSEERAARALRQVLRALGHVQGQGFAHRDIKLENFLYDTPESDHLKLIDFGFSDACGQGSSMTSRCGTLSYAAPEVLAGSYSLECDLWSVGVVAYVLLSGRMPFDGPQADLSRAIQTGTYSLSGRYWNGVSADALGFVRGLLHVDPKNRPTVAGALRHPWLEAHAVPEPMVRQDASIDALLAYVALPRRRRLQLEILSRSLPMKARAAMRRSFLTIATEDRGTISLCPLRELLLEHLGPECATSVDEALSGLHAEGRSELRWSEFLSACFAAVAADLPEPNFVTATPATTKVATEDASAATDAIAPTVATQLVPLTSIAETSFMAGAAKGTVQPTLQAADVARPLKRKRAPSCPSPRNSGRHRVSDLEGVRATLRRRRRSAAVPRGGAVVRKAIFKKVHACRGGAELRCQRL